MNKQLVNLIGALGVAGILALGILAFALPQFSSATATAAAADAVAQQNRDQQLLLDSLTAQSAKMDELDAAVADLRAQIPAAAHLDDILLLAVEAAQDHGGVVTSLTPGTPQAFAERVTAAGETPPPPADDPADPAEAGEMSTAEPAPTATPTPDGSAPAAADAPQQISATVVVEAGDVPAATRILDALRAGPRLVAVTQATVTTANDGRVTLSANLLSFYRP